ncbi:MAG: ABC transporter permease [Fibrobacterota bacterium]
MTFTKVSLNNLKRHPIRSILTALSLVVSAATLSVVLSLDQGYSAAVKEELVEKTGVHLYITKEGCPIEAASVIAQGGLSPLYVREDVIEELKTYPEISVILPFKLFALTTEDGMRTDIFMGVTRDIEKIKPEWQLTSGGWFNSDSAVILGAELARQEKLGVGDKLWSEHFEKEFVISGILKRNYGQDDGTIFMPLKTAQKLVEREGKLSAIALKLENIQTLQSVQTKLRASLPGDYYVLGSKELGEGILEFFKSTRVIMFVMVAVALLISVFGIVNTMLMSVIERRKEMAYLKCVGAGKRDLLKLIAIETVAVSIIGSALGTVLGAVLSPVFGSVMRGFLVAFVPSGSIARPEPLMLAVTFISCTLVGLLSSLYPAYQAAGISPMEVLRNE